MVNRKVIKNRIFIDNELQKEIEKARMALLSIGIKTGDMNILKLLTGRSFNGIIKSKKRRFNIEIRR